MCVGFFSPRGCCLLLTCLQFWHLVSFLLTVILTSTHLVFLFLTQKELTSCTARWKLMRLLFQPCILLKYNFFSSGKIKDFGTAFVQAPLRFSNWKASPVTACKHRLKCLTRHSNVTKQKHKWSQGDWADAGEYDLVWEVESSLSEILDDRNQSSNGAGLLTVQSVLCAISAIIYKYTQTDTPIHTHGFLLRVFEHVDACKDLECRSQLNVHSAHQVVLL